MATKKGYDQCISTNRPRNLREFHTGSFKPNLKGLFGMKSLISQFQLDRCSEAEKSRHLHEDAVLRFLYIEDYSQ